MWAGPAARVREEDLCGVRAAAAALLDRADDPVGASADVRADPHTRYSVIGSPYVMGAPTATLWFVTTVPGYAAASMNVTCSPY